MQNLPTPKVSVVVCTYNRAKLLEDALASLCALETQGQFTYEIVVVDNASTDETPDVIQEMAGRAPVPLRGVYEPRPGVACARNRGIAEARTPWIAFFDDDQVADPRWLQELLAMARAKQVRCVGGRNRLLLPPGETRPLSRACRSLLGESVECPPQPRTPKRALGTGNMLIARDVFEEIGTFDESMHEAGEDTDLFHRMYAAKIAAWYTPHAISSHVVPAYRLRNDYLRWKSLRHGTIVARCNLNDQGRVFFSLQLCARIAQALLVHFPRWLCGRLTGNGELTQDAQCMLWRADGYLRFALHRLSPKFFAQQQFFSWLEFRSEQQMFAHD